MRVVHLIHKMNIKNTILCIVERMIQRQIGCIVEILKVIFHFPLGVESSVFIFVKVYLIERCGVVHQLVYFGFIGFIFYHTWVFQGHGHGFITKGSIHRFLSCSIVFQGFCTLGCHGQKDESDKQQCEHLFTRFRVYHYQKGGNYIYQGKISPIKKYRLSVCYDF